MLLIKRHFDRRKISSEKFWSKKEIVMQWNRKSDEIEEDSEWYRENEWEREEERKRAL